jgi:hypothetical protein
LEDIDVIKALFTNHAYLTGLDAHLLQIKFTVAKLITLPGYRNYFSLHLLNIVTDLLKASLGAF